MAWHRHREKSLKQNKKRNIKNVSAKRALRSMTKELLVLIKEKNFDSAKIQLNKLTKKYATSSKRGILHKKNVSRHVSRLTKKVNSIEKKVAA